VGSNLLLHIHRALIPHGLDSEDLGADGKHVPECSPPSPLSESSLGPATKADTGLFLEADHVAFVLKNMSRSGKLMTLERSQAQKYANILDTVRYSMGRVPWLI